MKPLLVPLLVWLFICLHGCAAPVPPPAQGADREVAVGCVVDRPAWPTTFGPAELRAMNSYRRYYAHLYNAAVLRIFANELTAATAGCTDAPSIEQPMNSSKAVP